jgi:putative transposase
MPEHWERRRKRCKRWDIDGDAHFLTFSCFQRQPFLQSRRACRWLVDAIHAARQCRPFELWAFVLMPEHVHLLLFPRRGIRISSILSAVKTPVTRRVNSWVRKNAPDFLPRMADKQPNGKVAYRFWQRGGGYDRNLRSVRDIHEKFDYIHYNAVKRRLVRRPEDWVWSSYRSWAEGIDDPLRIDRDTFPALQTS